MKNDIQKMAYRMQVEVQAKENDAVIRAVQRLYGFRNESMRQMAEQVCEKMNASDRFNNYEYYETELQK